MKGLFCDGRKAKTNEEYLQILKKRQRRMYGLLAAGLLTMALSVILNMHAADIFYHGSGNGPFSGFCH